MAILLGLKNCARSAFRKPMDRVSSGIVLREISSLSESNFYVLVSYLLFRQRSLLLSPEKIAETRYGVNSGPLIAGRTANRSISLLCKEEMLFYWIKRCFSLTKGLVIRDQSSVRSGGLPRDRSGAYPPLSKHQGERR